MHKVGQESLGIFVGNLNVALGNLGASGGVGASSRSLARLFDEEAVLIIVLVVGRSVHLVDKVVLEGLLFLSICLGRGVFLLINLGVTVQKILTMVIG